MVDDLSLGLARLVQQAALRPKDWQPALNVINTFVGGAGVVLLSVVARERYAPSSSDLGELMEDYFKSGWFANDARDACVPLMKANGIAFDYQAQSIPDLEKSDYYNHFLARHRRKWFAGVSTSVERDEWCLAFQRSPNDGPFLADDLPKLKYLRGLLADAAFLARSIGDSYITGMRHALDANPYPAMVLDHGGRVLTSNQKAIEAFGRFIDRHGNIGLGNVRANARFVAVIEAASKLHRGLANNIDAQTIELESASYRCRAVSLLDRGELLATNASFLVVMQPVAKTPWAIMKTRYGLTDAETRVSIALAEGRSVKEVAAEHRVKEDTVRAQLKSAYSKFGVNTQSQLVALVGKLTSRDCP